MAKKPVKNRKNILLKVKPEQLDVFRKLAKRYTDGNVSRWIRTAASMKLTAQQAARVKRESA